MGVGVGVGVGLCVCVGVSGRNGWRIQWCLTRGGGGGCGELWLTTWPRPACLRARLLDPAQVLGAAQRRLMAENERGQGEDRRMFISPHMLRLLLRSRGLLPLSGSSDEGGDDSEEEGGSEGSGARGGSEGGGERRRVRRPDDICTIS